MNTRSAEALPIALLNSTPPAPAGEPTLRAFAAWPPEWEARFTLRARGGFVVTAAQQNGRVEFVEILSEAGAPLRLHNPWGQDPATVDRGGKRERVQGAVFTLPRQRGERLRLTATRPER